MNDSWELNDLFELDQECFDDIDLYFECWVADSEFSELNQNSFEMDPDLGVEFLVFSLLNRDINSNSDTEGFLFDDFMDVFQDFDNLGHDDNFLYDFF